jgi:hypothetical protein
MLKTTVFIELSPDVGTEIVQKGVHAGELIWDFSTADMPVISLAGFIVIPEDAYALSDQRQPVFVGMPASLYRFRHLPQDNLGEDTLAYGHAS